MKLILLQQAEGPTALCGEKKNNRQLSKCFVFVDHAWLRVRFNEAKHLHFRRHFSEAPSTTTLVFLWQPPTAMSPPVTPETALGGAACTQVSNSTQYAQVALVRLASSVLIGHSQGAVMEEGVRY